MNITINRILSILTALFLSTTSVFAMVTSNENEINTTIKGADTSSTPVPLAEENVLQETPEYKGTDPQLISSPPSDETEFLKKSQKTEVEEKIPYEPAFTNSSWEQFDVPESFYDNPYKVSLFSPKNGEDSARLWSQTNSIFYYGIGVVGVLAAMPSSITNWESSSDVNLGQKWVDNVTAGPVWDRDDVVLNYVMHPYFGGAYYQVARKSGYRQWDSFLYSVMMSTFFWEYGVEAFAETPSMQDLVVTPVLGWVYGEWAFNTERDIWAGGGTVLGNEYLGNTALFLLDPIDSVGRNVNRLFGTDLIKAGTGYIKLAEHNMPNGLQNDKQIMFQINYVFGEEGDSALPGISGKRKLGQTYSFEHSNDPVSYGIVGVTLGAGYINFDGEKGFKNQSIGQVSLGLYFSPRFSARLNYSSTELESIVSQSFTHYETFSVDGQYYFNAESDLRPYITAGIGEEILEEDKDQYSFQINAGIGLHYRLNANWALQAEAVNYYTTSEHSNDQQMIGKLIYRFGKGDER
ncbi:DUF3943 domain-containing protein [Psychromonas sp.]|nr:DUF3943 domain-containing protein [Psychromonas sp.]